MSAALPKLTTISEGIPGNTPITVPESSPVSVPQASPSATPTPRERVMSPINAAAADPGQFVLNLFLAAAPDSKNKVAQDVWAQFRATNSAFHPPAAKK